jgi:L-threonylcarbamoyladenylate synthase
MLILGITEQDMQKAAAILKEGGLVAFPTETVYGLGADAFNTRALAQVFEAKGRPRFDPLIIHIAEYAGLERAARLSTLPPDRRALVEKCAAAFWPGPLTLVLPKQPDLPDLATAGLSTAAIRWPDHPVAQALIGFSGYTGKPGTVAAPSANPFGRLSPTRAEHVIEGLGEKIDCVIDGGPCPVGVESTVLDLASPRIALLRPGGISREALENVIGPVASGPAVSGIPDTAGPPGAAGPKPEQGAPEAERPVPSPGMLKSHYAPLSPLFLHSGKEMAALSYKKGEAYLFFSGKSRNVWRDRAGGKSPNDGEHPDGDPAVLTLSENGNVPEAAANLFEFLHRLDALRPERIHAETLPEKGLGAAVNDRLRRAAKR